MLNALSVDVEDWFQVGAFEAVIDLIISEWAACAEMHVYHYAPYEVTVTRSDGASSRARALEATKKPPRHRLVTRRPESRRLEVPILRVYWRMASVLAPYDAFLLPSIPCIAPPIAEAALSFGPPEYCALVLLGLTAITGLTGKSRANLFACWSA